jgi:15-cis-phytoene synthase/lycopene beta-cyclase
LALLWFGAGLYIVRRALSVLISAAVPTILLCIVDIIALRAGVWHINEKTSTEIFVVPDLPIEEFGFFLLVNMVIVFACCAIDRTNAIIHTFPYLFSTDANVQMDLQNPFSVTYLSALFRCFVYQDHELPLEPIEDLKTSLQVLFDASKSFNTASATFSFNVRQDLSVLYGFCRATDEIADGECSVSERQEKLKVLIEFIDDLYTPELYSLTSQIPEFMDWAKYDHLPSDTLATFRAISRMVHYLPRKPFDELVDGYTWDVTGRTVENQDDLLNYCNNVASSVGDLCTAVIMFRTGRGNWRLVQHRSEWITKRAREMGQVLQLVNIARDIVTDSQSLGRCYVPLTYLQDPMSELVLLKNGKARTISDGNLRKYALRILALADKLANSGSRGIDALPMEVRRGVWAACQVYSSIGRKLRTEHGYPSRAHLNRWERCWVALRCLYGMHHQTANTRSRMSIWKVY